MERIAAARRGVFVVVAALALIFAIAVFRLPEEFVADLKRDRPLDLAASGWLYRLLALVAAAQAAYIGLSLLRPQRLHDDRLQDSKLATLTAEAATRSVARNAAGMAALTLLYGLGALILTGERGGMWLFLSIFAAQLAWNYRQTGQAGALFLSDEEAAARRYPEDQGATAGPDR